MNDFQYNITDKIINYGLAFIAIISLPVNVIVYFAINHSQCVIIKILPVLLSFLVIALYFYRNKLPLQRRTIFFSLLLFSTGLYSLILGLLDMASLWFILSIIFASFYTKKQISFIIFISALFFTVSTGLLMMFNNPHLPIEYGFDNCQFACVSIRIINFLIIGFLIFRILKIFFQTIDLYIKELVNKNIVLEQLKAAEKNEAKQNLKNQILKSNIEKHQLELEYKRKELTDAFSKILKFNNLLDEVIKDMSNKNYKNAIANLTINQSKNYGIETFLIKFNEIYPDFFIKLQETYPQLSDAEHKLCIFITSGLKSVEIAELLNVTTTTIGKYRNRIRKKLDLENNVDIAAFLLNKINGSKTTS